jgi:hypothetical protein
MHAVCTQARRARPGRFPVARPQRPMQNPLSPPPKPHPLTPPSTPAHTRPASPFHTHTHTHMHTTRHAPVHTQVRNGGKSAMKVSVVRRPELEGFFEFNPDFGFVQVWICGCEDVYERVRVRVRGVRGVGGVEAPASHFVSLCPPGGRSLPHHHPLQAHAAAAQRMPPARAGAGGVPGACERVHGRVRVCVYGFRRASGRAVR